MSIYNGGRALRDARRAAGLNQREAEQHVSEQFNGEYDITQSLISRYESGHVERVDIRVISVLCWVYRIPVHTIIQAYGYPVYYPHEKA